MKLPQGSARKGKQGNINGRGKHTFLRKSTSALPTWKGCDCAGAEPVSSRAAGRFPFCALGFLYIPGFIHTLQNKLPRAFPPSLIAFLPGALDGLPVLTGPLPKSPVFAYFSSGRPSTPWLSPHHGCTTLHAAENHLSLAGSVVAAEGQGQCHA